MFVEMPANLSRLDVDVLVDERAIHALRFVPGAHSLDLGGVGVRDGAVGRHEEEDVRRAGRVQRVQDGAVDRADLERSAEQGERGRPEREKNGQTPAIVRAADASR